MVGDSGKRYWPAGGIRVHPDEDAPRCGPKAGSKGDSIHHHPRQRQMDFRRQRFGVKSRCIYKRKPENRFCSNKDAGVYFIDLRFDV